jgi:hypothetical protein
MITSRSIKYPISVLFAVLLLAGCSRSDYTRMVEEELAKNERKDSIILGIKFGHTVQDFFARCYDLNREKLVTQGPSGNTVQYLFYDPITSDSAQMRLIFFPTFDRTSKIAEMNMEFSYVAWAPWNKHLSADSLKPKAMKLLMKWYQGNEFVVAKREKGDLIVKVDGNRRILVSNKDTQSVSVKVQDILHPGFKHED